MLDRHSVTKTFYRGRRQHTEVLGTDGDSLAVGLVDGVVNLLKVVRVRDELVAGDNVLENTKLALGGAGQKERGVIILLMAAVSSSWRIASAQPTENDTSNRVRTNLEDDHFCGVCER